MEEEGLTKHVEIMRSENDDMYGVDMDGLRHTEYWAAFWVEEYVHGRHRK